MQNPIFDVIRDLLRQGDTGQALRMLITYLENDNSQDEAVRTLRVIEANYNAARQEELKGIIAFNEAQRTYNRANDTLLAVLDDIEAGRVFHSNTPPASGRRPISRFTWLAGALALVLLVAVGFWALWPAAQKPAETSICPAWHGNGPKILLLPFQKAAGDDVRPEIFIQTRIQELSRNNNFPLAVEILTEYNSELSNPDLPEADSLGHRCDADMVIWGNYFMEQGILKVDARFDFIRSRGSGSTGFREFPKMEGLINGRMLKTLDDAVFALCALMAVRERNLPLAKKWLAKVKDPQEREKRLLARINELETNTQ